MFLNELLNVFPTYNVVVLDGWMPVADGRTTSLGGAHVGEGLE